VYGCAEDKPLPPLQGEGRLLTLPDPGLDPLAPDAPLPQPKAPPRAPLPVAPQPVKATARQQSTPSASFAAGVASMEKGDWDSATTSFALLMRRGNRSTQSVSQTAQAPSRAVPLPRVPPVFMSCTVPAAHAGLR